MRWMEFMDRAGDLGELAKDRIAGQELCMLGTIRTGGSPRISPCEVYVVDGELLLGMMWQSRKALDLLRDPRVAVHSMQCDKSGKSGDVKLYGSVVDVTDLGLRTRYGDTLQAAIDWRPSEPYHLFRLDIREAGYIGFGDAHRAMRWTERGGLGQLRHPDA